MTRSNTLPTPLQAGSDIERVLVLGCPGAGKTTLARMLGRETGLPVFHLDDHYWGPGWSRPGREEWIAWQRAVVGRQRWVIEGNHLPTMSVRLPHADLVVFLDTPTVTCLWRAILRAGRIRLGQRQFLPARIRQGTRRGERVPATKDFPALLHKILRFRRFDTEQMIRLVASTTDACCVVAVLPDPLGLRDRIAGHWAHGTDQWAVLPLAGAIRFVVDRIRTGAATPLPRTADAGQVRSSPRTSPRQV